MTETAFAGNDDGLRIAPEILYAGRLNEEPTMFAKLKSLFAGLAAGSGTSANAAPAETVEYKGYRIKPAPYPNNGVYQTAGTIEKDGPDGVREHRFVRADTHPNRDDAIAFAVSKAKQIIDLQGDRIFS
jgi:hypothetical protein